MKDSSLNKRRRPLSLSKTPFENTGVEFSPPLPKSKSSKLYSKKPIYVAREIRPEKLSEEKENKLLYPSLQFKNIPEEPLERDNPLKVEKQRLGSLDFDHFKLYASSLKNNIFQAEIPGNAKLLEHTKGPIFRNGKLLRHSVVGPPEIFEKNQIRKYYLGTTAKQQDPDLSNMSNTESLTNIIRNPNRSGSFTLDPLLSHNKKQAGTKAKEKKKVTKMSKDEVLAEIENMKAKETRFYTLIDEMANGMKTTDMLFFTREKRCLDSFQKTEERWTKAFEKTGSQLGRSPQQSVMFRAENFREKKERAEEIEQLKNNQEKLGVNFWHTTLRNSYLSENASVPIVKDELPIAFNTTIISRPLTSVEIIRKPRSLNVSMSQSRIVNPDAANQKTPTRLSDKMRVEYLEERLTHDWVPNQFKPALEEVQELVVKMLFF